ncbi:MAG: hypothetical protein CEE38_22780 [Planctomycetes bacterium B3_Pla]|nr:MAG: hypothetical protein CEE38_22780 [Planctomycetes bacterium B3_Pla]
MSTLARLGQNQGLWSQNGDTMSPGLCGVFQLLKEGDLGHSSRFETVAVLFTQAVQFIYFSKSL